MAIAYGKLVFWIVTKIALACFCEVMYFLTLLVRCALPTIIIIEGFRLYFFANEDYEPLHVHVQCQSATAKFWLNPVALAYNRGMKPSELRKAGDIVRANSNLVQEKWNEFFSNKT